MVIGNKVFEFQKKGYIMGILNVTPDSFSDGGQYNHIEKAKTHIKEMLLHGAEIIDIGGESTRPGHRSVSAEEELSRVIPMVEMMSKEFDCVISVDTTKAVVAQKAIEAGAHLINDIWGLKLDQQMAKVIAKEEVACCLMHNREKAQYDDLINDMINDIKGSIEIALEAGISQDKIIIDPGIGFAKSLSDNLEVMKNLSRFQQLGYPLLLGTSRKSMIGLSLDLPKDQRVEGTIATTVIGFESGARIFRVHDVMQNVRALRMTEAIYGCK